MTPGTKSLWVHFGRKCGTILLRTAHGASAHGGVVANGIGCGGVLTVVMWRKHFKQDSSTERVLLETRFAVDVCRHAVCCRAAIVLDMCVQLF